eukprot:Em0004g1264a
MSLRTALKETDAVSVVANSAVTMLSEGGVGCSVKWGKKLYYGDVVASGRILDYGSGADDEVSSDAETPSQPVPATTIQPVPATTIQPVPATTIQPVPATTIQPSLYQPPQSSLYQPPQSSLYQPPQSSLYQPPQSSLYQPPLPCICLPSHTNKVPITLLVIVTTTAPITIPSTFTRAFAISLNPQCKRWRLVLLMPSGIFKRHFWGSDEIGLSGIPIHTSSSATISTTPFSSPALTNHKWGLAEMFTNKRGLQPSALQ